MNKKNFAFVKRLLKQEKGIVRGVLKRYYSYLLKDNIDIDTVTTVLPILHNEGTIILQFSGWSINLHSDGTWIWKATDG